MKPMGSVIFGIVLISCVSTAQCSRILCLFTVPIKSHFQTQEKIVGGLVERGHNVTVVTTLPAKFPRGTHRHILLHMPEYREELLQILGEGKTDFEIFNLLKVYNFLIRQSVACLYQRELKELMEKDYQFDLVILGYGQNEVQLGVAAHFKSPVVVVWLNQLYPFVSKFVGNPLELSYVPLPWIAKRQPMSVFEKAKNYLAALVDSVGELYCYYHCRRYYSELFPSELYPSFNQVLKNVSLVLINHHFSQNLVKPLVPAVVEIGGIQIKEKQDLLPQNLQEFLDNASPSGAIYFSLGTSVSSSELGEKAKSIFKVLSSLPQKVIWKWEIEELPGSSSNILFSKWLPQDDILAHPNLRLFITHGGLGSITEARYHGVPVVGIPFFGDQYSNVGAVKEAGWGREVNFLTLNERNFREAIIDVLSDSKYTENVKRMSKIYRDRPMSPLKTAMFWIEYVIRHNGAPHMQSPAVHMNFISYYSLDVLALIFGSLYIFLKISKLVVRVIWSKLVNLRQIKTKSD